MTISLDYLLSVLHCDKENGIFTWKIPARRRKIGDVAGTVRRDGYVQIQIKYRLYLVHQLMIFVQYGEYPKYEIDHINRIRSDNRLTNLRVVTRKENSENKSLLSNNKSGYRGVCWDSDKQKWLVQVKHNGVNYYVGRYIDIEDANIAAVNFRNQIFTHNVENTDE